ncbi:MAG: PQQ-binding-like beta-propeller repeat protein [Salinimicrobium sp.]
MNKIILRLSLVVTPLLLLLFLYAFSSDPGKEPGKHFMFLKNKEHTARYESISVKHEPDILWKFKTHGQVISSPVIVDNTLFIGSNDNNLYAINASSGELEWNYKTEGPINSTPVVKEGKVMFLSYDGFFYALNQKDGTLEWKFRTGGESIFKVKDYYNGSFKPDFWDFYLSSAVVNDNSVYFGSSDSNIYALDIDTGEKKWNYKTGGSVHSSPAISGNSLVVGSWDSNVYCLDVTTGKEKWTLSTGKDLKTYIWLGVQASASIDDGVVYIGSRDAKFYAVDLGTGETLWTQDDFHRSWMPSSAAIGEKSIYTGSSDAFSFYSIDKKTGNINYSTTTNAYTFSSPAIDEEMAYIGAANGRFYGIELESGDIQWEFKTIGARRDTIKLFNSKGVMDRDRMKNLTKNIEDMPTLSSFMDKAFISVGSILSSPVISNEIVYFGSSDGYIYALTDKQ